MLGAEPVVATWGSSDADSPLVVLFHGRGADELSMGELVPLLPEGPRYAAVRAPLEEGDGYAWFANRGTGRPVPESLAETMSWFTGWLDVVASPQVPVVLVGFSGGAAFAGGLLLADPQRYAAGVLLYGTLPFDVGLPLTQGRLAGVPVFLAHGVDDTVIPRELQDRTWDYLVRYSGSALWAEREPTGHELTERTVRAVGDWLGHRLTFLSAEDESRPDPGEEVRWPTLPDGELPVRTGSPPLVSVTTPQQQESQNAPRSLQEAVFARVRALEGVETAPSRISVPGARAFTLPQELAAGPQEAYLVPSAGEFAHIHPELDGSLHLSLPVPLALDALRKGWAAAHPLAGIQLTSGMVMIFGPRDKAEVETVVGIVATSHSYAITPDAGTDTTLQNGYLDERPDE
jgi:phospholipase/carboxylesterase